VPAKSYQKLTQIRQGQDKTPRIRFRENGLKGFIPYVLRAGYMMARYFERYSYLASVSVYPRQGVFSPVLVERFLRLTVQGFGIVVLIKTILAKRLKSVKENIIF
jgi:hypothetical protein